MDDDFLVGVCQSCCERGGRGAAELGESLFVRSVNVLGDLADRMTRGRSMLVWIHH